MTIMKEIMIMGLPANWMFWIAFLNRHYNPFLLDFVCRIENFINSVIASYRIGKGEI